MTESSSRAGTKVLIVDDDEAIRSVMERLLRNHQIEVLLAADLEGAESILQQHDDIQVLLADLVLAGGQTGEDIVRRALELRPGIGCAYISGHGGEAIAGVDGQSAQVRLLRKPFHAAQLLEVIDLCLADTAERGAG